MSLRWRPSKACVVIILVHLLLFAISMVVYLWHAPLSSVSRGLLILTALSKASSQILSIDFLLLLISICHDLAQYLRDRFHIAPGHPSEILLFHQILLWCLLPYSILHVVVSWISLVLAATTSTRSPLLYLQATLGTVSGLSGHMVLLTLLTLAIYAEKESQTYRRPVLGYALAVFLGLWTLHIAFCQSGPLQVTTTPSIAWLCSLGGIVAYICQMAFRDCKFTARTSLSIQKIIEHPGKVIELRMSKAQLFPRIGQRIDICFPNDSLIKYHSFALSSAPEEDYLAIMIASDQEDYKRIAKSLCDRITGLSSCFSESLPAVIDINDLKAEPLKISKALPEVFVNGPYGFASEMIFGLELAVLIADNENLVRAASVLKSIWFRANSVSYEIALQKVFLFWIWDVEEEQCEWFRSLLLAIEAQDLYGFIEINVVHSQGDKESIKDMEFEQGGALGLEWKSKFDSLLVSHSRLDIFDLTDHKVDDLKRKTLSSDQSKVLWHKGIC